MSASLKSIVTVELAEHIVNTFVKVDAQKEENGRCSWSNLQLQETE